MLLLSLSAARAEARQELSIWSAYSGREEIGLRDATAAAFQRRRPDLELELLSIPFGAYLAKLEAAIPTGNGPDLFVDSHERMPELAARDLLEPWPEPAIARALFAKPHIDALSDRGKLLGLPLALKSLALYVNTALVPQPVATTAQLRQLRAKLPAGTYPLVFEAENPYYAAAVLHAFGGSLLSKDGEYAFVGAPAERTLETLDDWTRSGTIPEAPSGDLVKRLFATGKAATAISGPWLATDLRQRLFDLRVEPLPALTEAGGRGLLPFVTIEAAFVTRHSARAQDAFALAAFLAGEEGARIRARSGGQVVALAGVRDEIRDPRQAAFARAAATGIPMPVHPRMHAVWEPAGRALQSALRGRTQAKLALTNAAAMFARNTRAPPARAKPAWLLAVLGLVVLWGAGKLFGAGRNAEFRRGVSNSVPAYRYLGLTTLAVVALVIVPLLAGVVISFFSGRGRDFSYVGLGNYIDILSGGGGALLGPGSFWFVLGVTLLWTALNVAFHLLLGGTLALLLNRTGLLGSKVYRIILILPWAVPSYVTALTWKGMFHRQFGAINALLQMCGFPALDWSSRWLTAFFANLLTNVWLGFPFMMVVVLGALTSIPKEVYEAAAVDGASGWQRLRLITMPMLRPTLAPAVVMGAAWTFNMFNVVFLVSGGEPGGTTDILVSEAYRWAFTRSSQYGYAAAYAVLIFGILLLSSRVGSLLGRARTA